MASLPSRRFRAPRLALALAGLALCAAPAAARSGSGSLVGEDGTVLTAAHVIEGCTGFAVVLPDQRRLRARIVGIDPVGDMALLRVPLRGAEVVRIREDLQTGETVEHHGFPHGARQAGRTVRSAVAGLQGPRNEPDSMALRGEIRSGDSGAGVFDAWGNLVGMAYGGENMAWYAVRAGRIADFLLLHGIPVAAGAPAEAAPPARRAVRVVCVGPDMPARG